ncbi:MAG: LamG domain-containing protein, partial [Planctomycetota bacterium]|nr:LamG domain-containing protein [Planctomycetota bacterium]
MKLTLAIISVVLAWPALTVAESLEDRGSSENRPADATIALALGLRDGSQVRGKTRLEAFAVACSYGTLNVLLADIRTIVVEPLSAKGETWQQVRLEMNNGDKLTGRPKTTKLDVETPYGTLTVPLADTAKIEVSAAGARAAGAAGQAGPALHYTFDEKGDTVADTSGRGNHGTVCGATWTPNGKVGGAYDFDENRYIDTGCNLSGMDEITVAGWVRPARDARGASVATQFGHGAQNDVWGLWAQADSSLDLVPPHKSYASVVTAKDGRLQLYGRPTGVGKWTHLCFTFKRNGQFVLYQNGVLVAQTAAGDAPLRKRDSTAKVGASLAGDGYWGFGTLDEIMIFDRALSGDEVAGLYRAGGGQPAARPAEGRISVPANGSADAGEVIQGHRYWFEATGLVGINVGGPNGGPAHKADPDGHTISQMDGSVTDPQPADSRFPCPGLATHSLVGKIGGAGYVQLDETDRGPVVRHRRSRPSGDAGCVQLGKAGSFVAPASGRLVLLCNDLIPGDNSGSWRVKISDNSAGPVLHLAFDTDEGAKVTDLSGKGNHGTVVGAKYTPQGKKGGAYCLSGTNEHIT